MADTTTYDDGSSTESEYYEELEEPEPHGIAPEPVTGTQEERQAFAEPSNERSSVNDDMRRAASVPVQPVAPDSGATGNAEALGDPATESADTIPAPVVVEAQPSAGKCGTCTATLPAPTPDMPVYHRCKCCKLLYPPKSFLKGHCLGCLTFARWSCAVCGREGLSAVDFSRFQRKQEVRTCKQCIQSGAKPASSVTKTKAEAKPEAREESEMKKLKREIVELKVASRALKKRKQMQKTDPSAFTADDAERYAALEKELQAKSTLVLQNKRKSEEIRLKSMQKKAKKAKS